ncbi:DUF1329 domain-containing protein [Undibacterium rugosum]|nr:DUF1329 domain-containing protein [Undibacterium rugosum]
MNMTMKKIKTLVAVSVLCATHGAFAAEADKLGTELTPLGADKSGNKEGTIPAIGAPDTPKAGWSQGKNREDFWTHKGEKPLFTIDASNVDKYADKLSPAQVQMLKQTKGYHMDIYPSHRTCSAPDFVQANTKINATRGKIGSDGWSLEDAALPGVPFPLPKKGIEVLWNFLAGYQGVGVELKNGLTYISPRPGSTEPIKAGWSQINYFPWAKKGTTSPAGVDGYKQGFYYTYNTPAAFAGQGIVENLYFKKELEAFYYFTGQRRVRRLPAYAYDAPVIGFENQYPIDATNLYFGNPDRFDWKLLGKKEMYISYNNFKFNDGSIKPEDAFRENSINPALERYELHRVWVVEGTVKQGFRHSAPKKVMYFDEDSWNVAVGDDYDAQGKIWKLKENKILPVWELGGTCANTVLAMYDLIGGRYVADNVVFGAGAGRDMQWFAEAGNNPKLKDNFYTADNLKTISER